MKKEETKQKTLPRYVDYKDVEYLRHFVNPHAKIISKRRSRVSSAHQRKVTRAIKRARFMALMPYISR